MLVKTDSSSQCVAEAAKSNASPSLTQTSPNPPPIPRHHAGKFKIQNEEFKIQNFEFFILNSMVFAMSLERAALYLPCHQSTDCGDCAPARNVRQNLRNPATPSIKPLKLPRGCGGQASVPHGVGVQRERLAPSLWCRSPYFSHSPNLN
jgi:hypothetical protein